MGQMITFQIKTIWHFRKFIKLVRKLFKWEIPESGYKGSNSDWLSINAGVPQGFILEPLLFIIFLLMILFKILTLK